MIFDVVIKDQDMVSEDIVAFMKLVDGVFKIWLDTTMTCNHIGPYKFKGDFVPWFDRGMIISPVSGPPAIVEAPKKSQFQFNNLTMPKRQL
jgi:hypothetical protein